MTTSAVRVTSSANGVRIDLRVIPRSPRSGIDGVRDGRLLLRVTAPPVDQAANDAVVRLLADQLQVRRGSIAVVSGETGRNKTVEIAGATASAVTSLLERLLANVKR